MGTRNKVHLGGISWPNFTSRRWKNWALLEDLDGKGWFSSQIVRKVDSGSHTSI